MADGAPSFTDSLTYKIGPLPAWAWGVGLGGTVLAVQTFRRRSAASVSAAPPADAEAVPGDGLTVPEGYAVVPSPFGGGSWVAAPAVGVEPDPVVPQPDDTIETNDQWRRLATDWLISQGFTPTLAVDALVKWFDGDALNDQEVAAVNAAIRQFGGPPDGAPSIVRVPAPTRPAPTPAPGPAPAPRPPTPAPAKPPVAARRPNLAIGSSGPVVSNLTYWLNTHSDGGIGQPFGTYHAGHERAVDKMLKFLNNGYRDPKAGSSGVNQWTYGLIDYLSQRKGVATV